MPERMKNQQISPQNKKNMLIAALLGQIGVLTLIVVLGAAFGGMALDAKLDTKPWFTIGFLVASIPVSLLLMVWIAKRTVTKIKAADDVAADKEDTLGKNS